MPHSIELIDGNILTPFGIRDLLEAGEVYAGKACGRAGNR